MTEQRTGLWSTIVADICSNADPQRRTGLDYWSRVLGKLLFAPTVQVVAMFRIGSFLYRWPITRPISYILRSISIVWGGTEIHPAAQIGPGFCLVHSQKVVIGAGVTIGANARISHGVSIGSDPGRGVWDGKGDLEWPIIGDDVTVALDSIILGPVVIGDGAIISAQSLVVRDVPARSIVAGSPARVVRALATAEPVEAEDA